MRTYYEQAFGLFAITVGIGSLIAMGICLTAPDSMIFFLLDTFGG